MVGVCVPLIIRGIYKYILRERRLYDALSLYLILVWVRFKYYIHTILVKNSTWVHSTISRFGFILMYDLAVYAFLKLLNDIIL